MSSTHLQPPLPTTTSSILMPSTPIPPESILAHGPFHVHKGPAINTTIKGIQHLHRSGGLFSKLMSFKVEDLFTQKRVPGPPRTVYVNQPLPEELADPKGKAKKLHRYYVTNQVITSKYTVLTFFPRNMLEQFRRVANMFFLGIAILQFFPLFTTINPGVSILPLLCILFVTALKDGYEDIKRHQSDSRINHGAVEVLRGGQWANHNLSEEKTKTFIRGIMPKKKKSAKAAKPLEKEADIEAGTSGEPTTTTTTTTTTTDSDSDDPHWHAALWEDIKVGDFVRITNNMAIPADLLICATSEVEDVAFVETKNLDGETNLKSRNACPALTHLRTPAVCADPANALTVQCDRPDTDMYRLNATTTVGTTVSTVDLSMTLLRGTVLKNTEWVVALVLFTGLDTKIVMNSGVTPSKRSKVERQMNIQVFLNLLILAIMAIVCGAVDSSQQKFFYPLNALWLYGADTGDNNPSINGLITTIYSLLTFQIIVPISLYISIEFVKTCQAAFIYFDGDIYYAKTDQATLARSWNLSDDLGQIEYIFSDKTGTLTQNSMVFQECSVGGRVYRGEAGPNANTSSTTAPLIKPQPIGAIPASSDSSTQLGNGEKPSTSISTPPPLLLPTTPDVDDPDSPHFHDWVLQEDIKAAMQAEPGTEDALFARSLNGFFTVLGLCHTVLASKPKEPGETIVYKAQSPDEAALVQAAADVGFVFVGRDKDVLELRTPFSEVPERYRLLNVLEFTSARKRMSVIVRRVDDEDEGDGRLMLLTKGADNIVFSRLRAGQEELLDLTEQHLSEFARGGLRTLTLAYKMLKEEEYQAWSQKYYEATISLDQREERIEAVSDEMERDLRLLGATAIEDRLQDGVPETIADLKKAGIKIWVATGDKMETAIAIGRSTNLVSDQSNIIVLRGGIENRPVIDQMNDAIRMFFTDALDDADDSSQGLQLKRINTGLSSIVGPSNGQRDGGFILVADGAALLEAFATDEAQVTLLRLATSCEGVICCRVSPLQKALVVKLVKDGLGSMTLAIGDGANDVSMIQAADVGVGISGEEGLQAANSSDYAIAQFRFLKKLLLVHGHWSYARNGIMILNFFYKNILPVGVLWWFMIYCGWSGAFVFDYTYILLWNSIWTIAPVIGIGLFDRFADSDVLMDWPQLYQYGREARWFSLRLFVWYMVDGIYQSVIVFFFIKYTYTTTSARQDGYSVAQYEFSTTMAIAAVTIANIFTGFAAAAWSWWIVFAVFIGIVIVWVYTAIYSSISPLTSYTNIWGSNYFLFHSPYFWFTVFICFVLCLAPRLLLRVYETSIAPDDLAIIRVAKKTGQYVSSLPEKDRDEDDDDGEGRYGRLERMRRPTPAPSSGRTSRAESYLSAAVRPSGFDARSASRTDMSTMQVTSERGFDFMTEERGVAMNQLQRSLTEIRERENRTTVGASGSSSSPSKGSGLRNKFSFRNRKKSIFKRKSNEKQDKEGLERVEDTP